MGGHSSKQTVHASATVVGNVVQNVAQSCINYVNSDNVVAINGNGNFVGGVTQSMSIAVDSACVAQVAQSAGFENSLQASVSQVLKDQGIASTQWMDGSKTRSGAAIKQTVQTNVTANTVQTCLNGINSHNILNVSGSNNVVKGVVQSSTVNLISQCLLGQGQQAKTVNDITDTVNQHSEYTSKSPFAFIADAIETLMQSAMAMFAAVFIVIICFIGLFVALRRGRRTPPAAMGPVIIRTGY